MDCRCDVRCVATWSSEGAGVIANIKAWLYGIAAGAVVFIAAFLYRKGGEDARNKDRIDDYENAEDIRSRVSRDRDWETQTTK